MKKHFNFKSMYRTALVALCLITVGVGNAWATGKKTIYLDVSSTSWWKDGNYVKVHAWGGGDGEDVAMTVIGESNILTCQINDDQTSVCFYRYYKANDEASANWHEQSVDATNAATKNRWAIGSAEDKDGSKWKLTSSEYEPNGGLAGTMNAWNVGTMSFEDGEIEVELSAQTAYTFKIVDGTTWYGCSTEDHDYTYVGQTDSVEINTSPGKNVMLITTEEGTYKFGWCSSTKKLKITFPSAPVKHPNMDYVYMEKYSNWNSGNFCHIDYWDDSKNHLTVRDGSKNPKIQASTYFINARTGKGDKNFYTFPVLSAYPNFKAAENLRGDGGSGGHATSDMKVTDAYKGHYVYWKDNTDGWVWATIQVYIRLEDEGADEGYKGTRGWDVAFNDTALSTTITTPQKAHYDFGGYYTGSGGTGTQIIDANGEWQTDETDYFNASGAWIYAGDTTKLYAKWTEHPYSITLAVDQTPSESTATGGTIQINGNVETSVNAYYVTESAEITAVPSSPAYRFKEWRFTKTDDDYDVYVSDDDIYSSTSNTIKINAEHTGTLTAVFEPKFYLVGVKHSTDAADGGMPGWADVDDFTAPFIVTSTSPLTATCTRALDPNTTFKFLVRNRDNGLSYGYATPGKNIGDESLLMNTADGHVYMDTKGYGDYTFTISNVTEVAGVSCPTVSVSGPTSYQMTLKRAYVKITGDWFKNVDDTGGSVSAQTTESGHNFDITDGKYVAAGGSIKYTATPATGYTFGGWWNGNWEYKITDENPHTSSSIAAAEDFKAKFDEISTTVTLSNDGHGKVQIGGEDAESTTCGVTTKRAITAVPDFGYSFNNWTTSATPDFHVESSTSASTDLYGNGSGTAGTLTANFTENTHTISVVIKNNAGGTLSYGEDTGLSSKNISGVGIATASGDITAVPANDAWRFVKWEYDGDKILISKNGYTSATIQVQAKGDADATLTAVFEPRYGLIGELADGTGNAGMPGTSTSGAADFSVVSFTGLGTDGVNLQCACTLEPNKQYKFKVYDRVSDVTRGYSSADFVLPADGDDHNKQLTGTNDLLLQTVGGGTYTFKITHMSNDGNYYPNIEVLRQASSQLTLGSNNDNCGTIAGHTTEGESGYDVHHGSFYANGCDITFTATPIPGCTFSGWYNNADLAAEHAYDGEDENVTIDGNTLTLSSVSTNKSVYAKWTSTNFVIYRTGDMSSDPRRLSENVETYAGGSIDKTIEFRMKVSHLDHWYSLCLPFKVNAVKVYDAEDKAYYDLKPYYRTGGIFYTGHYVIRTPELTNNDSLATAHFSEWNDPEDPDDYVPSWRTPYIVQWHHGYFQDRYVSFFGAAEQTIPESMSVKNAPKTKNWLTVAGNDAMVNGSIVDAYTLNGDETWERPGDKGQSVTILPFECYIRANSEVTNKYLVLRRGMNFEDVTTDFETIDVSSPVNAKVLIDGQIYIIREGKMYTIQGVLVQ